jgi:ATP-dependent Zn protease
VTLLPAGVQVQVEVPDVQGRWDILKVHAKNKKLADDVNLESVAMRVPGEPWSSSQRTLWCDASAHACLNHMQAPHTDVHDVSQASAALTWPTC